jgi:hypothetical protein
MVATSDHNLINYLKHLQFKPRTARFKALNWHGKNKFKPPVCSIQRQVPSPLIRYRKKNFACFACASPLLYSAKHLPKLAATFA